MSCCQCLLMQSCTDHRRPPAAGLLAVGLPLIHLHADLLQLLEQVSRAVVLLQLCDVAVHHPLGGWQLEAAPHDEEVCVTMRAPPAGNNKSSVWYRTDASDMSSAQCKLEDVDSSALRRQQKPPRGGHLHGAGQATCRQQISVLHQLEDTVLPRPDSCTPGCSLMRAHPVGGEVYGCEPDVMTGNWGCSQVPPLVLISITARRSFI